MTVVTLTPWAPEHLPLLIAANSPEMTQFLGGPESDDAILRRQERYVRASAGDPPKTRMFAIEADGTPVGGIGVWPTEENGEVALESGWNVLPDWQGRGIAKQALLALIPIAASLAAPGQRLLANPSVENAASNAVCRAAGFVSIGEQSFPFRGAVLHTRIWALELNHHDACAITACVSNRTKAT